MLSQLQSQKEVRTDLRSILHAAKEKKHELVRGTGQQVLEILSKAQELNVGIARPQEEIIASEIHSIAVQSGFQVAKKVAAGTKNISPADFLRALKAQYVTVDNAQEAGESDPDAFQWLVFARRLSGMFRPAPCTYHMLGPMDAVPKAKRQVAQRRKKASIAIAVRPDDIEQQAEEKQETDRNMETMWSVLGEQQGHKAKLVELVINHTSFAQTVENMFTLSFLVKENKVELINEPDGVCVMKVKGGQKQGSTGDDAKAKTSRDSERVQFMIDFDFDTWNHWKKFVRPIDALMPHRDPFVGGQAAPASKRVRNSHSDEDDTRENNYIDNNRQFNEINAVVSKKKRLSQRKN